MQGENSLSVYISKVVQLRLKSGAVTSANRPVLMSKTAALEF